MVLRPALPTEIIEQIIANLRASSDVRAASLVSQTWHRPAQRWLFSQVTIDYDYRGSDGEPACNPGSLLAMVSSRPKLANLVRVVQYECFEDSLGNLLVFTTKADTLQFPNLTKLKVCRYTPETEAELPMLLSAWRQLEYPSILASGRSKAYDDNLRPKSRALYSSPLRLKSLDIGAGNIRILLDVVDHILLTPTRATLQYVILMYDQHVEDDGET
jgi:hypothetical protein